MQIYEGDSIENRGNHCVFMRFQLLRQAAGDVVQREYDRGLGGHPGRDVHGMGPQQNEAREVVAVVLDACHGKPASIIQIFYS